jgi:ribose transport system permease protein
MTDNKANADVLVIASPTVQSPSTGWTNRGANRSWLLQLLERYSLILLVIASALFFAFYGKTSDTFFSAGNLRILLAGQAVLAIVALAALIPLVCERYDLSIGAIAGLASVASAEAMSAGTHPLVAMSLGIGIGLVVGAVNALLIVKFHINSIITTLGTSAIIAGIVSQKTSGLAIVSNIPPAIREFGSGVTLGIPNPVFVLIVAIVAVYYLLEQTPLGRHFYAMGSNEDAARLVGLPTNSLLAGTFVVSGTLSGMAGVLQVAYQGGADPGVGPSLTLPALAAAFLSAAVIKPGRYNALGTVVAVFFLAVLSSGLNLAGAPPYVSQYVNGGALLLGVGLAVFFGRRRALR